MNGGINWDNVSKIRDGKLATDRFQGIPDFMVGGRYGLIARQSITMAALSAISGIALIFVGRRLRKEIRPSESHEPATRV